MKTVQIRTYLKSKDDLKKVKSALSENWGRNATYADAINFLVTFYLERKSLGQKTPVGKK